MMALQCLPRTVVLVEGQFSAPGVVGEQRYEDYHRANAELVCLGYQAFSDAVRGVT